MTTSLGDIQVLSNLAHMSLDPQLLNFKLKTVVTGIAYTRYLLI